MMPAPGGAPDPHAEYAQRLVWHRDDARRWSRRASWLANGRLAVFAAGVLLAWLALGAQRISGFWLGLAVAVFAVLIVVHDRTLRLRDRAVGAAAFCETGLARLEDRWVGGGNPGERFRDPEHPYAEDLDVFGRGSLFEYLCTARTRAGEETLAAWLRAPASLAEARARQAAVAELAPRLDLREDVALLSDEVRAGLHPDAVRAWGEAPASPVSAAERLAAPALALGAVAALAAWLLAGAGPLPFLGLVALEIAFAARFRRRVARIARAAELPARDLDVLARLLERFERERFEAPRLAALRAALAGAGGVPASRRIARLRLLVDLLDARRNQLFLPIAALLLWTTQIAFALERWRAECGPALGRWIETVGELEALACFGGFAFEHPDHALPELVEGPPRFEADALGHPLLPEKTCVRNDVRLDPELRVWIVSGSNMSGKSTLLRAVGVASVLGLAGAPVRAAGLRLTRLSVGASIRVSDSLLEGRSRFYAEIRRLRRIVELAEGEPPVLFLLDEILHGTNSHDRGIGAEAVVRGLVARGAIGLVTTHDLALARVADALAPRGANVHFEDHLEDGEIAFDYRVRPGVVTRSNALELMRSVGLDV